MQVSLGPYLCMVHFGIDWKTRHIRVIERSARIVSRKFLGHWVKGHWLEEVVKFSITCKFPNFLYSHMHLKVVETNTKIFSEKFQGHGVRGQRSPELKSAEMANFMQIS